MGTSQQVEMPSQMENELALLRVRISQVTSSTPTVSMPWTSPLKETSCPCPKFVCEDNCGLFSQKPNPANTLHQSCRVF